MIEIKEVSSHYGINHALSIIGKYRWRESRLNDKYDKSEVSVGLISPQVKQTSLLSEKADIEGYEIIEDEQCLNLNIFTPTSYQPDNANKNSIDLKFF